MASTFRIRSTQETGLTSHSHPPDALKVYVPHSSIAKPIER